MTDAPERRISSLVTTNTAEVVCQRDSSFFDAVTILILPSSAKSSAPKSTSWAAAVVVKIETRAIRQASEKNFSRMSGSGRKQMLSRP
jgi:hypothetical protein